VTNRRNGRLIVGSKLLSWLSLVLIFAGWWRSPEAWAEDLKSTSAHLADESFALLDRLSKQSADNPNPLLGLVAAFAGDADSLRQSVALGDLQSASSSLASLQTDRAAVDQALRLHPDAIPVQGWNALSQQVDNLARKIPPCRAHCGRPPDAVSRSGAASPATASDAADAPRIVIASRESGDGIVHLKGYFEGRGLKSAGIYEGSTRLKAFNVNGVLGRQRVEFDLRFADPSAATVLRVADGDDRTAEAPIIDPNLQAPPLPPASEISVGSAPSTVSTDVGETSPRLGEESGVAEIPSHGPLLPSPSKRHTLASKLGDVRINILGVTRTRNLPPTYEIFGQIIGRGITSAGIYLDGNLLQRIPITDSASYTSFDQQIVAQGGSTTIRAYSVGNQFIEQSVDLLDAEDNSEFRDNANSGLLTPAPVAGAGIAIQVTGVRPAGGSLYLVNGIISGPDIASAGLYQNGVLAQNIVVATGLTGALGALIPGWSHSINFSARFNPYVGPATVRAFNSAGAFTEQPVVIAGVSPSTAPWPTYSATGTAPFGRGLPPSGYPNRLGSTRPLW
jgi:hypothetical protein